MRNFLLLFVLAFLLACASPPPTSEGEGGSEPATFWQLQDDSEMAVKVDPWPGSGEVTLQVETTPGDWGPDRPIVERVDYQVSSSAEAGDDWTDMGSPEKTTETEEGESWEVHTYQAPISAKSGDYIHFRVHGEGLTDHNVLTGWQLP